jgi:hypothetical protein
MNTLKRSLNAAMSLSLASTRRTSKGLVPGSDNEVSVKSAAWDVGDHEEVKKSEQVAGLRRGD